MTVIDLSDLLTILILYIYVHTNNIDKKQAIIILKNSNLDDKGVL